MKELLVDTRRLQDSAGRTREYAYYLLIGEMQLGGLACEDYGVAVRETGGACASVTDITVSAARIDELLALLIRNTVTPVTLADVVEDWL